MEKSSGLSYYDSDRLFTECVERNLRGNQNTIGTVISQATYAVCWSAFTQWSQSQIDQGRPVVVQNFGTVGYSQVRENLNVIYTKLSAQFLQQHGLTYNKGQEELEKASVVVTSPATKPNFAGMSKTSGIDKQTMQSSVLNTLHLIGELLGEGSNVEIDLQEFGKFSAINRQVIYAPLSKQKPQTLHGKQTVKSLMENVEQKRGGQPDFAAGALRKGDVAAIQGSRFGQLSAISGGAGQSSLVKSGTMSGAADSPTRRYLKPSNEAKISSELLGAGDDPMSKKQEFSLIANNPAQMMALSFKRPGKAVSRYPPVIDPFSRTVAAPISSQRHYFGVCHRIGTNLTPSAKGFFIDSESRNIKYKDVNDTGTKLDIVGLNDTEPAEESEEYEHCLNQDAGDPRRIRARRVSYERYRQYVENEISKDVIAPIRQYWLSHILELIPGDLHAVDKDRVEYLVDAMLNEINKDYHDSVRKAILDYILKDENEMRRLGIQQVLNEPIDWGDNYYKGIEPNEEWKHNVMMARMLMSENLCICSNATLELMKLWQEYEQNLFVKLPDPRTTPVHLTKFKDDQDMQMNSVKVLLSSDWNKSAVDILREELENLDKDQTKTFFESVATLMANQVRELIAKSVKAYVEFFRRFKKNTYPRPQEVIQREYDPDSEFEDNFLILTLQRSSTDGNGRIEFSDGLDHVKQTLEKVVDEIVAQSQGLPRPENTIARSDKMHLWEVSTEDELVKNAKSEVMDILEHNLDTAEMALDIYKDYMFILKERPRIEHFCQGEHPIEDYVGEIRKLEETIRSIRKNMPFEIRMNMFLIDCAALNQELIRECQELIATILRETSDKIFQDRCGAITSGVKAITEVFAQKIDNSKKLVEAEKHLEHVRLHEQGRLQKEYDELLEWLSMLYNNPCHKAQQENIKSISGAFDAMRKLPEHVTHKEENLKDERDRIETALVQKRGDFKDRLKKVKTEIVDLKDLGIKGQAVEALERIKKINANLADLTVEMQQINDDEADLEFDISEHPLLKDCKDDVGPFEEFWNLIKTHTDESQSWRQSKFKDMDPEKIQKDHKSMMLTQVKLVAKFQHYFKEKKLGKIEQLLKQTKDQLTDDQKKVLPLIAAFCNGGLQERHWKGINELLHAEGSLGPESSVHYITTRAVGYDDPKVLQKLDEISDRASKEYGNEKAIAKMYADWEPTEFAVKEYKGTFILDGEAVENNQALLDDHLIKTQGMKGSPFAQVFIEEITKWENQLLTTQENLDLWIRVQAVWLYLEPVFSSEDILKQMPVEGNIFRQVDNSWKQLMQQISENTRALDVMKVEGLGKLLTECHKKLEEVQKGLNNYLEGKRGLFPRFCFLSDGELLEILSETKEPLKVQPHLKKCFEGIAALEFDDEKKIHGMYSSEDEYVPFVAEIDPNASKGNVEDWLCKVEDVMLRSVKDTVEKSLKDYANKERDKWITAWQGQAVLCVSQIFWTSLAEEAMKKSGVSGLAAFFEKLHSQLNATVAVVRTNISRLQRCTLEALIVLDVHAKDVIQDELVANNVCDASEFAWLSQLRYYWDDSTVVVKIINAVLGYNFEYLGNSPRLVITPLTDRCYRTLCGAIHLNYGGAPEGPAGTGKTETVKDLSKALARQCIVFNCSDGLDYLQMAKFFKGLAQCGAWSCFDEFNRIELEVLSVIAQQLQTIQNAIDKGKERFLFEGSEIPLKATCNCFITMNPGYAGRSELPDNLKVLFRSVAMMVPDYGKIASISLYSFGFTEAANLAGKIVTTYVLCSEQLSSQSHYDYGMRAVKSVLTAAGNLKRKYIDEDESILMLRAINDVNLAKFLSHDLPLFKNITSDLFPGVVLPTPDYAHLLEALNNQCKVMNLQPTDYFITKVIQLYEMVKVRHGLMIVGLPWSGKSMALKVLGAALGELASKGLMEEMKTHLCVINPKSITMGQLYGNFDPVSHDWSDGVLAVWYRNFATRDKQDRRWLIFDGPVDAIWIENMNTVLDDNKKLCLMSGEIIAMTDNMNMIFEPMDLLAASPATVSRCGMVYLQPAQMGWEPIFESWKNTLPAGLHEEHRKAICELVEVVVDPCLSFLRSSAQEGSPSQDQTLVVSLLKIWKSLLKRLEDPEEVESLHQQDKKKVQSIIDSAFVFSAVWSLCITVTTEFRRPFDLRFKQICNGEIEGIKKFQGKKILPGFFDRGMIYDFVYNPTEDAWKPWMDLVDRDNCDKFPRGTSVQDIIVTTDDTVRYSYIQKHFIENNIQSLFVGPTGTGKSVYIQRVLRQELTKDHYETVEIGFSAQTHCNQAQDIIDLKLKKRVKDTFGPAKYGVKMVVFVDDLNMPKPEKYKAQPPIEILRQFVDSGGWYDRKDRHPFVNIVDTMLVCAMGLPGGGKSFITPRFLRHFAQIGFISFDEKTMTNVFTKIINWYMAQNKFKDEVQAVTPKVVAATALIYKRIQEDLKPTPLKSHYTFNLRDFSKVICGMCMANKNQVPDTDVATRLWAHETIRVFGDRLINDEDRMWMLEAIKESVRSKFGASFDTVFHHLDTDKNGKVETLDEIRGLIFGDVLTPFGLAERPYEEIQDKDKLQHSCEDQLTNYNSMTDKPMELVLFSFALEHLLRISRILKQQGGHALLVGVGGSGRQSLTRLAAKMADMEVFQVEIKKNYRMVEWREDVKTLLRGAGGKGAMSTFIMTDSQIKEEGFLEDVNNILNTGEVPNIFPPDEKVDVCESVRPAAKSENRCPEGTPEQLFSFFVERCIKKLHIVLCFSPIGNSLRDRIRNFPSLVNCTTIDWFSEWPKDALESVAKRFLNEIELEKPVRASCVKMVQYFHESTRRSAEKFLRQEKRNYYVTPTSYLELITTFKALLKEKREEVAALKHRYEHGYSYLIKTEGDVGVMQRELEEKQPKLVIAQKETEEKSKIVEAEASEAQKVKDVVAADEAVAKQAADEASAIAADCKQKLDEAMPLKHAAQKAVDCINKGMIAEIKAMKKPPDDVRTVLTTVCLLFELKPVREINPDTQKAFMNYWPTATKMITNSEFLSQLQGYDYEVKLNEEMTTKVQEEIDKAGQRFEFNSLKKVSEVAAQLSNWVKAMLQLYQVNLIVRPKQALLKESQDRFDEVDSKLKIKQAELRKVEDKVNQLQRDLQETMDKKQQLEDDVIDCANKLERAKTLINGLGGEKARWSAESEELGHVLYNLTGDVLVASGMIAYLGAFTSVYRGELAEEWVGLCQEKEIPSNGKFSLQRTLGDPVKIRTWQLAGLPSDIFSVENGIITSKTRRWPLFIDPQGQANKWIKNLEDKKTLKVMKFSQSNYLKILENCIRLGHPVIIENVHEELDPAIEPLLQKQIFKKGNTSSIRLGDQTIEYSNDFKFFMTTKLRNPHYLPEVSTKVTLINFMITKEGLTDQLLGIVVAKENPELEQQKEQLVIEAAQNKNKLEECEDQILKTLTKSKDILGDAKAIEILSNAKKLSDEIEKKQEIAEKTEKEIDEARVGYQPCAVRTAGLFFCITDLANIDPMYQYSLPFFISLFANAITNSEPSEDLTERLDFLNAEFLISLYRNICRSLFEKDKLIFSFLLCIKLLQMAEEVDQAEFMFLLTGGVQIGENEEKSPVEWLTEKSWGEIIRCAALPSFKGAMLNDFKDNIETFQQLFDSQSPDAFTYPPELAEKYNSFQRMLILRCLRGDKIVPAMQAFVIEKLGEQFIKPPPFDLNLIYKDSSNTTPLIFVLSPGSDPKSALDKYAESRKKEIQGVSLGQGQGPKAEKMIKEALESGGWVVLQNCHLAVTWMSSLEKICEDIASDPKAASREFRLWLTSYPSKDFPVSILQNGIKMTNEPPKGLANNLVGSYLMDPISNRQFFDECTKPREFRKLLFGLCFFHALIQERRKFGALGWNIPYGFNDSDLKISVQQLKMFLDQYPEKVPFDALKYLTGQCNYGGRVTEKQDRLLLATILEDYYTDKIFDDNYRFSPSGIYFAPKFMDYEGYLDYMNELPKYPEPEVFGLHANASITKDNNETRITFDAILSTQSGASGSGDQDTDAIIQQLAEQILADVSDELDVEKAEKKYPPSYEQSMNTVLTQEIIRFNRLISEIRQSLKDLKKAIKGEVLLSATLEGTLNSLLIGRVPQQWKDVSYPSLKPLGSYIKDLIRRIQFFDHWEKNGIPTYYNISLFYFTQGFMTGALQNYARRTKIAIDNLVFDFEVVQAENPPAPENGILVFGTFMEGCRWNFKTRLLDESDPKVLYTECPMVWLKPCQKDEIRNFPHYACPLYKTSERRGTLMTTGHSTNFVLNMRLPSDKPQSHWIKRGVAQLCCLDD